MSLTQAEKAAGRTFRQYQAEALSELNRNSPPDARCSPYSPPFFRHECKGLGTTALALKTRSAPSPGYMVSPQHGVLTDAQYAVLGDSHAGFLVPRGRFFWVWLEGDCHACGFTVRSGSGYLIVNEESNG